MGDRITYEWMRAHTMGSSKTEEMQELEGFDEFVDQLAAWMSDEAKERFLAGLKPEDRLAGLKPEDRLAGLKPEDRLAGLEPDETVLALPDEVLRRLPESFIESLPEKIQSEIRRRLGH